MSTNPQRDPAERAERAADPAHPAPSQSRPNTGTSDNKPPEDWLDQLPVWSAAELSQQRPGPREIRFTLKPTAEPADDTPDIEPQDEDHADPPMTNTTPTPPRIESTTTARQTTNTAGKSVFISPQTIDRVAFNELSDRLATLIGSAERTLEALSTTGERADLQRSVIQQDLAQQKTHMRLMSRLLRAIEERAKKFDTALERQFSHVTQTVEEQLKALEATLGVRAQDLDLRVDQAVARVDQTVGKRVDSIATKAETLRADLDTLREKHAANAQQRVDQAAATLVGSIRAQADTLAGRLKSVTDESTSAIRDAGSTAFDALTTRADELDRTLETNTQALQTALNDHAASAERAIETRGQAWSSKIEAALTEGEAAMDAKLLSAERIATAAAAKVEARIGEQAERAESRVKAACDRIADVTDRSMGDIRSAAAQATESAASDIEDAGRSAHTELDAAFDDRLARLDATITARRAQLADQLDKAEARLRMVEKVERRIEDKTERLLDGFDARLSERTDAAFEAMQSRLANTLHAVDTKISEAEQRHRDLVADIAEDADRRINAFEALFHRAHETIGLNADAAGNDDPAPGSLADLILRAGDMIDHLHISTTRLAAVRDEARHASRQAERDRHGTPPVTIRDSVSDARDTAAGLAHPPSHPSTAPDPHEPHPAGVRRRFSAIMSGLREPDAPPKRFAPVGLSDGSQASEHNINIAPPEPANPDETNDADPMLSAIDRLRETLTRDLHDLSKTLSATNRNKPDRTNLPITMTGVRAVPNANPRA